MSSRVASYFAAFAVILAHNMIFTVRGQPTVQDFEDKEQLTIELFGQLNKQVQSMQVLLTESMQDMKNQLESVKRSLDQRLNQHDICIKNQTQNSWKLAVGLPVQLEVDLGDGPVLLPIVNNWIVIMHRFDGSLNFNRNWTEYRNGFGDKERGEFWLGNEIVHRLTNTVGTVYTLRIEDRDALSGCPTKARMQGLCTGTNDDYYGCLTLTRVNGTSTVCLAPPEEHRLSVQMGSVNISLGNGSIPLPSVNNWIVLMQRFDGSLDFYRNWTDYRNGFGDTEEGEFWLGNEIIHLLTNTTGSYTVFA